MSQPHNPHHRKILSLSMLASLALHVLALSFFQRNSLWFSSCTPSEKSSSKPWISSMEIAKKQQILKEAFEPVASKQVPAPPSPQPLISQPTPSLPVQWQVQPMEETQIPFTAAPSECPLLSMPVASPPPVPPQQYLNLFDHLPKDLVIPKPSQSPLGQIISPVIFSSEQPVLAAPSPPAQEKEFSSIPIQSDSLLTAGGLNGPLIIGKAPIFSPPPQLPHLPSLAELQTVSYSDAFDAELVFLPNDEEGGYIFALTLIPRVDLKLPKLKQHYLFLIDRSNSIQSERLFFTKNAVLRALDELDEDDSFNIISFDSKIEKMSPTGLKVTSQSKLRAEQFLDSIKLGNFFSSTDLSKSLFLTIPTQVKEDEIYSALIFTDGETLSKKNAQKDLLSDWTRYNSGRVALFPIGVSSDPHLATLDTAAMFNQGRSFFAPTNRGIKRKVLKTMKSIHSPVAKRLSHKTIPITPHTHVQLYPKSSFLSPLYLNEPYVILGSCDTLDDFILFVQGHLKDRWVNIKKKISFLNAKKGGSSLKSEWALQRALIHYENFLQDGNPKHLVEAHLLLDPYNLQVAFE